MDRSSALGTNAVRALAKPRESLLDALGPLPETLPQGVVDFLTRGCRVPLAQAKVGLFFKDLLELSDLSANQV
jgi:hypothetical protein